MTRQDRFDAKWLPEPNSGCHLWHGGRNEHNYGIFWNGTRLEKAHRFAFRAAGLELGDEQDLLHRCDTPACVNPEHLFVGDAQTNVDDMWRKGRATVLCRRGEAQTQAKLSDKAAAEIRASYVMGGGTQRELAAAYGVSQSVVWRVLNNRSWRSLSGVLAIKGCRP